MLFFVIERLSKNITFAQKLSTHLFQIILKVIPETAIGNQHLDTVDKVVRAWKEARIFPDLVLKNVDLHLKNVRDAAGFVPMSDIEKGNSMKKIEVDREGVCICQSV